MPRPFADGGPDYLNLVRLDFSGDRVAQITLDRLTKGRHRYLDMRLVGEKGTIETSVGGSAEVTTRVCAHRGRSPLPIWAFTWAASRDCTMGIATRPWPRRRWTFSRMRRRGFSALLARPSRRTATRPIASTTRATRSTSSIAPMRRRGRGGLTSLALAIATKGEWDPHQLLAALAEAGATRRTEVHLACDPAHRRRDTISGLSIHPRRRGFPVRAFGASRSRRPARLGRGPARGRASRTGWFAAMSDAIEREGRRDGYWGPVEPDFVAVRPAHGRLSNRICAVSSAARSRRERGSGKQSRPSSAAARMFRRGFFQDSAAGAGPGAAINRRREVFYMRGRPLRGLLRPTLRHGRAYAAKRDPAFP